MINFLNFQIETIKFSGYSKIEIQVEGEIGNVNFPNVEKETVHIFIEI